MRIIFSFFQKRIGVIIGALVNWFIRWIGWYYYMSEKSCLLTAWDGCHIGRVPCCSPMTSTTKPVYNGVNCSYMWITQYYWSVCQSEWSYKDDAYFDFFMYIVCQLWILFVSYVYCLSVMYTVCQLCILFVSYVYCLVKCRLVSFDWIVWLMRMNGNISHNNDWMISSFWCHKVCQ